DVHSGPSLDYSVDRLNQALSAFACRKIIDFTLVEAVTYANLDLIETVEDVELGQCQAVDAAGAHGLANQHGVEPPAAPAPARDGAELATAITEQLPDIVVLLGRKWALSHPRRIGLADAEHVSDRAGTQTAAGRRLPRDRVGGGHERICAVIDVEEDGLRPLEQDALAFATPVVEQSPHSIHVGQHFWRDL